MKKLYISIILAFLIFIAFLNTNSYAYIDYTNLEPCYINSINSYIDEHYSRSRYAFFGFFQGGGAFNLFVVDLRYYSDFNAVIKRMWYDGYDDRLVIKNCVADRIIFDITSSTNNVFVVSTSQISSSNETDWHMQVMDIDKYFLLNTDVPYRNETYYFNSVTSILDYTVLDYIESTGTQYIDTGFVLNGNSKVMMSFQNSSDSAVRFFGNKFFKFYFDIYYYSVYNATYINSNIGNTGTNINNIEISKNGFYFNNTLIRTYTEASFTYNKSCPIFAGYSADDSLDLFASMNLYSCKIYDNDTLVRDYIPVRRNSDNTLGLYDRVTGHFFMNKGTGDFVAGSVSATQPTPTSSPNTTPIPTSGTSSGNNYNDDEEKYGFINDNLDVIKDNFGFSENIQDNINDLIEAITDVESAPKYTLTVNSDWFSGKVTVLDLSWYAPYKEFGDTVICIFAYCSFLWHIFIRLPDIIQGSGGVIYSDTLISKHNLLNNAKSIKIR